MWNPEWKEMDIKEVKHWLRGEEGKPKERTIGGV
jgi:hypothetical protein